MLNAADQRGIADLVRRISAEQFRSLWDQTIGSTMQNVQAQINAATMQSSIPLGGQDPAAVGRTADEGQRLAAARADHVHALDLQGGEAIEIGGQDSTFEVSWQGVQLGELGRAIELDFDTDDFSVEITEGVATIRASASLSDKYGPPASGQDGIDLSGARWHKSGETWYQKSVGVAPNWGQGGATDILDTANWTGAAVHDQYLVIEPGVSLWSYVDGSGWEDMETREVAFVPSCTPPYSGARSKAMTAVLPPGTDWHLVDAWGSAEGSVGVWGGGRQWDLQITHDSDVLGTSAQNTSEPMDHYWELDAILSTGPGGAVVRLRALPSGRPGLLVQLCAALRARRLRMS